MNIHRAMGTVAVASLAAWLVMLSGCGTRLTRPTALVFDQPAQAWRLETVPFEPGEPHELPETIPAYTLIESGKRLEGYPGGSKGWHVLPYQIVWSTCDGWFIRWRQYNFPSAYSEIPASLIDKLPKPKMTSDGLNAALVVRMEYRKFRVTVSGASGSSPL